MPSAPVAEHTWLQQFVGKWRYDTEVQMAAGEPPLKCTGTETVRSLGSLWIVAESEGEMPGGGAATMQLTLGFDPQKRKYVGTWVGSMMTHLWLYEGELGADGITLTLDTEGPDMVEEGKIARYRDVIQLKDSDHRTLTSHILGSDGTWQAVMTSSYGRI